jgi:hypothetical protein
MDIKEKIETRDDLLMTCRYLCDSAKIMGPEELLRVIEKPWNYDSEFQASQIWNEISDCDDVYLFKVRLENESFIRGDASPRQIRDWLIDGKTVKILESYPIAAVQREFDAHTKRMAR